MRLRGGGLGRHRAAAGAWAVAAVVCTAVTLSWAQAPARPAERVSDADAAALLDHLLDEHAAARAHRAGEVLDAVVGSLEYPGGGPLADKFPSERARDEERVAAAVRALDDEEPQRPVFSAEWLQEEVSRARPTATDSVLAPAPCLLRRTQSS